ncbi:hypothetical protein [Dyella psychrodurans]|uniref:Lipoprotein n=1 Tax=Dyella psychrodurans TaxID=1927960 RepID=A0A370X4L8_9GAMM|nr:hypothetical protein [Dyella psychrodurans]RDS83296.1 hypothetical protein DWU99_12185 [Dyella psychrodurans]
MKTVSVLLCMLTLAACSGKPPAPESDPKAAGAQSISTPWDAMKKDEQRAKDVQKIVDKQAADQAKQIDQQSQ